MQQQCKTNKRNSKANVEKVENKINIKKILPSIAKDHAIVIL